MCEVRHLRQEINEIDSPGRLTSADSFDDARDAVEEGDVAYVSGYLSKASAEAHAEINGKTLLHHAAKSGQVGVISELLAASFDPHLRCSTGETPIDLAGRNGHTEALSLLLCHGAPPPSPAANDEAMPSQGKTNPTGEQSRKPGRLIFGRKLWGSDSTSSGGGSGETPMKDRRTPRKGRGKRPGCSPSTVASGTMNATPGGQFMPWLNDPLQEGWVLCTDSDGYQYYWNEALQESRWADVSGNRPAVFPEPSPAHSAYAFGSTTDGLPSPVHLNAENHSWETSDAWAVALGIVPESPVHSPGWPSPRGARGGFMHLPPPTPKFADVPPPRAHANFAATSPNDSFTTVTATSPNDSFTTPPPPSPPTPGHSWISNLAASSNFGDLARGISWSEAETAPCTRAAKSRPRVRGGPGERQGI